MHRLLTPWLVLPLLLGGLLLTGLTSESIRREADQAWQQRLSIAAQGYSETMMVPVDMNAALLSALGGLFIGSNEVQQAELDKLFNYLQMPHLGSDRQVSIAALQYRDGRWQTLLKSGDAKHADSLGEAAISDQQLQQCSADKRINLLIGAAGHLLMCSGIPDKTFPQVLVLEFHVDTLLSSAQPTAGMHFQLSLSPRLNKQRVLLTPLLAERPDAYALTYTSTRYSGSWEFNWQGEPQTFGGPDYRLANTVAIGGAVMAVLMSLLVMLLVYKLQLDRRQSSVRNQFARRMEQERDRAQLYLNTAQVLLMGIDLQGRINLVNRKVVDALGYSEDELLGQDFRILLPTEDIALVEKRFSNLLNTDINNDGENRLITRDGQIRWFHWHNAPLLNESGELQSLLCSGEDITERRRMENALRELATDLSRLDGNALFERACHYLTAELQVDIGFVGQYKKNSDIMEAIAGHMPGSKFQNFSYALEHTPCADALSKQVCAYACDVAKKFPLDTLLQDMGISGYLGAALQDRHGQPIGIVVLLSKHAIVNIGFAELLLNCFVPRLAAELERQLNQEKLLLSQRMFETSNDGFFIMDAEGICQEVNQTFCQISGYARDELIGEHATLMLMAPSYHKHIDSIRESLFKEHYWSGEILGRRKNGEQFNYWLRINALRKHDGDVTHFCGSITDITREKTSEQLLEKLAFYDTLTGLPNRALLRERLQEQIRLCNNEQTRLAVLQIDLDNFKLVNETLGYSSGDMLVIEAGKRLKNLLGETATLARVGGDDFTIILPAITGSLEAAHLAEQVLDALKKSYCFNDQSVYLGGSIGIAMFPDDADNSDALLKAAETALYRSKEQARGSFNFFTQDMNARNAKRLTIEHELRRAIDNGELCPWYQPKYSVSSGAIVGFEALLRWQHPDRGLVPPLDFIPLAEENGLIIPIGEQVLEQACEQLRQWHTAGHTQLQMAVNLSPKQFQHRELLQRITAIIAAHQLPHGFVELEITESATMADPQQAVAIMQQLRAIGVTISIDDFGTGYSSLSYLKRFPLNTLKIDQSFVRHLSEDSDDAMIVTSIISLAKSLNLQVVAEGVETREQLDYLRQQGCDLAQGYLLSKPLPASGINALLGINA